MTTPLDIISGSLRSIGALAGGEPAPPDMANDALVMLNDLLDQLSNERMMLFCVQEVIHSLTAGKYVYGIGPGGDVGATFTGTIAGNKLTVASIASGALSVGQTITASFAASGTVTGFTVATTGIGYTSQPTVSIAGGGGTGAAGSVGMQLLGVPASFAAGAGYTANDIVTLVGGTFTRAATVRVLIAGGAPVFDVVDGGNYSVLPGTISNYGGFSVTGGAGSLGVSGGTGAGMQVLAMWGIGSVTVTNGGSGYGSAPAVTVTGGIFYPSGSNSPGTVTSLIASQANSSVAAGSTITSYGTGLGGNGISALGTYYLNLSQTGGTATMTSSAPRPIRINSGFVRVPSTNGTLDFPIDVLNAEQYERVGLKGLNGPWPRAVYYQPSEPLGILNYWPNPSQGEMHLFCDMLLNRFATLNDTVTFPQGYVMALRWMLAEILMPEYPATAAAQETRAMIPEFARQARALIKRTNMQPIQQVQFDPILNSSRTNDAGFIMHGGFR